MWDLDHAGNWTHTDLEENNTTTIFDWDFTHNKVNEITDWDDQSTQVAPTYDAAGNMTDDKRDWKYTYDAWYRLVEVRDLSDNLKAQFRYNGLGYRVSMRYDDTDPWYHFSYDERWRVVAMFEGSDTDPTEQFWYQNAGASGIGSSSYIDEVVLRDRDTDGNGSLDERLYYCQNWHHDVVALCGTSGSVSERANYDAYGSPIGTLSSIGNRKGYAAYEYDDELSDTYHVRFRVLRNEMGIWIQRDPISYIDLFNLYDYATGNPLMMVDPLGLVPINNWIELINSWWDLRSKIDRIEEAFSGWGPCAQYIRRLYAFPCDSGLGWLAAQCTVDLYDLFGSAALEWFAAHQAIQTEACRLYMLAKIEEERREEPPPHIVPKPASPPERPPEPTPACKGQYAPNPFIIWDPEKRGPGPLPGIPGGPVPYQGPLLMILPLLCPHPDLKDLSEAPPFFGIDERVASTNRHMPASHTGT